MRKRKQRRQKSLPEEHDSSLKDTKDFHDLPDDKKLDEISKTDGLDTEVVVEKAQEGTKPVRRICGISVLGVFKVMALVTLVPPFLNYASLQKESHILRPHGGDLQLLPQGHKLFMKCNGEGQPVVMMDTPAGFSSDIWSLIQPQVAKFTKVCVYDRTGLGFSENLLKFSRKNWNDSTSHDSLGKRMHPTTENMADNLRHLLKIVSNDSAGIILVGGGLGAINMRFYSRLYENVFGLLLVNSFFEEMFSQGNNEWTEFWYEHFIPSLQIQQVLATLGITRLGLLTGFIKPDVMADSRLDDDVKTRLKYLSCNSEHLTSGISEHFYINESLAQLKILRKLKPFPGNVSVEIISSKKFSSRLIPALNDFWMKNQELLVDAVFPVSERMFVNGDFYKVYIENAADIVRVIRKLVLKFRKSTKQTANI